MGMKIWCLGTTFVIGAYLLNLNHDWQVAGAILMLVGNVLMFLNQQ